MNKDYEARIRELMERTKPKDDNQDAIVINGNNNVVGSNNTITHPDSQRQCKDQENDL